MQQVLTILSAMIIGALIVVMVYIKNKGIVIKATVKTDVPNIPESNSECEHSVPKENVTNCSDYDHYNLYDKYGPVGTQIEWNTYGEDGGNGKCCSHDRNSINRMGNNCEDLCRVNGMTPPDDKYLAATPLTNIADKYFKNKPSDEWGGRMDAGKFIFSSCGCPLNT